tara:strand:- start:249 stop:356 length:108 start_codon:yes stop_codon:yes gene_type:complete
MMFIEEPLNESEQKEEVVVAKLIFRVLRLRFSFFF